MLTDRVVVNASPLIVLFRSGQAENLGEPLATECGSGSNELIYPKELLPKERERATRMLEAVNGQAQQLLDELAG